MTNFDGKKGAGASMSRKDTPAKVARCHRSWADVLCSRERYVRFAEAVAGKAHCPRLFPGGGKG